MFKALVLSSLALTSLTFQAHAFNVNAGERHYLKVTKVKDRVSFEECFRAEGCVRFLGPKKYYSLEELKEQRVIEKWQIAGSVGADVLLVAGAAYGGAALGVGILGTGNGLGAVVGTFGGIFGGGALGAAAGGVTAYAVDALNPHEQYKQARTVRDEVIEDEDVKAENLDKFIRRLEVVLDKLGK